MGHGNEDEETFKKGYVEIQNSFLFFYKLK